MPVPLTVNILILFQHLVQIQRPVQRKFYLPLDKILRRQMKGLHHLTKHLIRIILKIQKISVFQPVILLPGAVTAKNLQKFFHRQILRPDIQIQKAAGNGYSH